MGIDRYDKCYEHTQHAYALSPQTLDRVEELAGEIPADMPLIIMLHDDPIGISRFHRGTELLRVLGQNNLRMVLFGHVQGSYIGEWRGIKFATVTGDDRPHDTSPLTYNIVTCQDDGEVECTFYPHRVNVPELKGVPAFANGGVARPNTEWLDMRGPGGSRIAADPLPGEAPKLAWCQQMAGRVGTGSATLADGRLYITTMGDGRPEDCRALAFDASSGEQLWSRPLDGPAEGGLALHMPDAAVPRGYAATSAGSLYAFDLEEGENLWQWNNRDNMPIACQPYVDRDENVVHCGANWEMYAIDALTGERIWRAAATDNGFPYMGPGSASPLVVDDRVYHQRTFNAPAPGQNMLQSVDKRSGRDLEMMQQETPMHPRFRHASPIYRRGLVFAVARGLAAVDPARPGRFARLWEDEPCSATPAVTDDLACVSYHSKIVLYDLTTGQARWDVEHEPAGLHFGGCLASKWNIGEDPLGSYSSPLIAGDKVVVCDGGGRVRCLALEDGRELWRVGTEAPILSAPVLSGNTLYVGDYDGKLYAFAW